jgi:ribosomal protein S18 acetylase RimI-like enzyme
MALAIRPATLADVAALDAVEAAAWDPSTTPGPLPLAAPFDARLPLATTLVAAVDGAVIGYATVGDRDGPAGSAPPGAVLRSLAVAPTHRGRGVGAALLAAAHDLARRRGYRRLSLHVMASNASARALYRRAGYAIEVVFPGEREVAGVRVDELVLAIALV